VPRAASAWSLGRWWQLLSATRTNRTFSAHSVLPKLHSPSCTRLPSAQGPGRSSSRCRGQGAGRASPLLRCCYDSLTLCASSRGRIRREASPRDEGRAPRAKGQGPRARGQGPVGREASPSWHPWPRAHVASPSIYIHRHRRGGTGTRHKGYGYGTVLVYGWLRVRVRG